MTDYRLYEELADIYIFQNNFDKAEEVIQYARELHPESGTGLYLEGYLLAEKQDYHKAIEKFNQANSLFPNTSEVLRMLGWCYMMIGSMPRSIAILERAHKINPHDDLIAKNLATAQLLCKEKDTI